MRKNYGFAFTAASIVAAIKIITPLLLVGSVLLSFLMGFPFVLAAYKLLTNKTIIITIIIVIGLVAIVKAKKQPRYL